MRFPLASHKETLPFPHINSADTQPTYRPLLLFSTLLTRQYHMLTTRVPMFRNGPWLPFNKLPLITIESRSLDQTVRLVMLQL